MSFLHAFSLLLLLHSQNCFSVKTSVDVCKFEKDVGPCMGIMKAWHYDEKNDACKAFTFGGCMGNGNRFRTKEKCEEACSKKRSQDVVDCVDSNRYCRYWARIGECSKNSVYMKNECRLSCGTCTAGRKKICDLTPKSGDCFDMFTRWHHDLSTGTCKKFTFSGCNGNKNNFPSKELCEEKCVSACEQVVEG